MGSGSKFKIWRSNGVGLGFNVARFPFALTFNLHVLLWGVSLGLGKGYDE